MSTSRDDFGIVIRSALLQRGAKQKFSLFVLILLSLFIFILDNSNLKPIKIYKIGDYLVHLLNLTMSVC